MRKSEDLIIQEDGISNSMGFNFEKNRETGSFLFGLNTEGRMAGKIQNIIVEIGDVTAQVKNFQKFVSV